MQCPSDVFFADVDLPGWIVAHACDDVDGAVKYACVVGGDQEAHYVFTSLSSMCATALVTSSRM